MHRYIYMNNVMYIVYYIYLLCILHKHYIYYICYVHMFRLLYIILCTALDSTPRLALATDFALYAKIRCTRNLNKRGVVCTCYLLYTNICTWIMWCILSPGKGYHGKYACKMVPRERRQRKYAYKIIPSERQNSPQWKETA